LNLHQEELLLVPKGFTERLCSRASSAEELYLLGETVDFFDMAFCKVLRLFIEINRILAGLLLDSLRRRLYETKL
jgi:hypothetical protein